jgi:hypothetical protein
VGKLPAQRFGWVWMIDEDDLEDFIEGWDRKVGRPYKTRR